MKKPYYLLLLGLLLLGNFSWANKSAAILKTAQAPAIDGVKDPGWNVAPAVPLSELTNAGTGAASVSGTWRAMWDATNVYLLFEIKDNVAMNNGAGNAVWYIHDCIEMFTDMKNLKNDVAVTNSEGQYQLRFIYGLDNEAIHENPTMTGYKTVSKTNLAGDGYIIEVSFPWATLTANTTVAVAEGLEFGLDFKVTDVDVATSNDWWPSHFEYAWNSCKDKKAINFGTAKLVSDASKSAVVLSTNSVPSVDGNVDALWTNVTSNAIANLSNAGTGAPTVNATWKSLWDKDNLYLLFEVKDNVAMNNGAGNAVWYIHDCIEVFTDMVNLKNDAAVTNTNGQYQLRFIYGLDQEPIHENPTMTGYQSVSKANAAGDGYIIEVKFPWSLLTANTSAVVGEGYLFGMDFKVTDVDVPTSNDWWPSHFEYAWNSAKDKKAINFGSLALAQALDTQKPTAPTALAGTLTGSSVSLSWTAATDNFAVVGYNIKAGSQLLAGASAAELTKVVKLQPGTDYTITVTAIDAAGNESDASNSIHVVTEGLIPLPAGTPIAKTVSAITIDGLMDEASWATPAYVIARIDTWAPNYEIKGKDDFSASFKGLWDENNLYLSFNVTDDGIFQGTGAADGKWVNDCIEVIIAKDETTNYKYRFVYGMDNQSVISGTEAEVPTGFKNASVKTAKGYTIEASIPWSAIPEIKQAVQRSTKFSISFAGTDIDKENASQWTDLSGVIGWPYGSLSNAVVLANADELEPDTKAPAAPVALTGDAPDYKSLNLSWTAPADADVLMYTVMINNKLVATTRDLTYKAIGLLPTTSYSCAVFANDAQNYSPASNTVTVQTKEQPQILVRKVGIAQIDFDPSEEYESWDTIKAAPLYNPDRTFDSEDLSASWKAMWDKNYLYFQVNVKDATIYNSGSNGWENDNIEMFFDMNGERDGTSCESEADATNWQIDNFQYRFIAYDKARQTGSQNAPVWTGVQVAYYDIITGGKKLGYTAEIAIPWTSLTSAKSDKITFKPELLKEFAFEIQVADADPFVNNEGATVYNNGDANGSIHWNKQDNAIKTNRNNSQYGKIFLSNKQIPDVTGIADEMAKSALSVYPNPVKDVLYLQVPSSEYKNLVITDLSGRTVLTKSITSAGRQSIQLNGLTSGIYIVSVNSQKNSLKAKVVVQ